MNNWPDVSDKSFVSTIYTFVNYEAGYVMTLFYATDNDSSPVIDSSEEARNRATKLLTNRNFYSIDYLFKNTVLPCIVLTPLNYIVKACIN